MNQLSERIHLVTVWSLVAVYAAFPMVLGLANALMLLVLLLWCFGGHWPERWQVVRHNPVAWFALALYGLMLVGVTYTTAPFADWMLHLKKYSKLLMFLVWLTLWSHFPKSRAYALNAFAVAMAFTALSTWLNVWWLLPWSQTQNLGWGVTHHVFGDYITQNVMMSLFVLLTLYRAHAGKSWVRGGWVVAALLAAISITHLSQGRTGYVLLVVVMGVYVFTQLKGKTVWIAMLVGALTLAGLMASSDTVRSRFDTAIAEAKRYDSDNISSIGHRLYNYRTVPKLVAEKPLWGWGTGAYHTQICRVLKDPGECPVFSWHPHNQYLFIAAEHGLIGMAAFMALLVSMAWVGFRSTDPQARTLLLGLFALLSVDSLFNSPLWSARENHFFTLMGALLVSMAHTHHSERV